MVNLDRSKDGDRWDSVGGGGLLCVDCMLDCCEVGGPVFHI